MTIGGALAAIQSSCIHYTTEVSWSYLSPRKLLNLWREGSPLGR
jgi:hypothetical protein